MEEKSDSGGQATPAGTSFQRSKRVRSYGNPPGVGKVFSAWNRVAPFFMSAALFLSGFFAIFAPLPFLIVGTSMHWAWLLGALLTNSALVYFSSGPTVFHFYLLAFGVFGGVIPLLIFRRFKPEAIVARAWIVQAALAFIVISAYALHHGISPMEEARRIFSGFFDLVLATLSPEARDQLLANFGGGEAGEAEWRRKTLLELPGALGILCLFTAWFNLRILFALNPNRLLQRVQLDRKVLNRWKNADWLVWPTLGAWAVVLFLDGTPSDVALSFFKVFMAAYGIQGLAVMAAAFDAYRIGAFFRLFAYSVVILLMMPLLLSIGFFDQWFDFRSKFRQT